MNEEAFNYKARKAYCLQVIEAFERELDKLLKHFHEEELRHPDRKFFDKVFHRSEPETEWSARYTVAERKITRIWLEEPLEYPRKGDPWLTMRISVPEYEDPYLEDEDDDG